MRVLYVNKISPLTGGGAELRLWQVARGLARRGHRVEVICGRNDPRLPASQTVDGVRLHNLRVLPAWMFRFSRLSFFLARYLFYVRSAPVLRRVVRDYDVVMDCASPVVSLAGPAARAAGVPAAVTVYETFGHRWFRLKGPVTAVLGYLGELLLYHTRYDAYITLSRATFRDLVRNGKPEERVFHLSRGAGVQSPPMPLPEVFGRPARLVCVSRLVRQKNVAALLRVFARVRRFRPDAQLTVVGDGPDRAALERAVADLGLGDCVGFSGRVSDAEKWRILGDSSVFVFPSLQEGFGIVLLEAMAAGLPVVAYDLSVYGEFMRHGQHGYLVPPDDEARMAQYVLQLLNDEAACAQMGESNMEHAESFAWERAVDQEEAVLNLLVQPSGRIVA